MNNKKVFWRVGQVALVILVSYFIVRALAPEVGKLSAQDFKLYRPRIGILLLATALLMSMYLTHAEIWRWITARLAHIPKPGVKDTLRIYFVSSLGRYIPGKLWQIAGMAMLAQKAGIPPVAATAASLVAQFAFLSTGLVFLSLLLPSKGGIVAAIATLAIGAGAFFMITATRLGHNIRERITRRFGERVGNALMLLDRVTWSDAIVWWILYAITWALLGGSFVVFVMSFYSVDPARYFYVAGTVAASYLAGYIAFFSMAGLGVREVTMFGLLSQVMPPAAAVVVSAASRLWFTAAELLPLALIPIVPEDQK